MTNPLRKLWRAGTPSRSRAAGNSEIRPSGNELLRSDRRLVKRHFYPLSAAVRYGVAATEEQVGIHNFSDKGLCFRSEVRLPVGAAVEITTTLPHILAFGGRTVRYLAHVVRVNMHRGEFLTAALIYRCETLPEKKSQSAPIKAGTEAPTAQTEAVSTSLASQSVPPTEAPAGKLKPRRFSRYHCASQVQFRTADAGGITSGELINLSLSGCYVQTATPCPLGATVEIVVQAGRARIYTHGRVKAVQEKQGMAVEFAGDLPERLQRLPRFVQVVSAGRQLATHHNN